MADLIDRAELKKAIKQQVMLDWQKVLTLCIVDDAPAVDAEPVRHGHWEPYANVPGYCRCSACKNCYVADDWPSGGKWNYCPECGAKMDEVDDGSPKGNGVLPEGGTQ